MSLNWREIELILSELPLEESVIQKTYQIGFNGLLFELYHPQERAWPLYIEVGSRSSRLHRLSQTIRDQKNPKLQRFIQFLRANIEGAKIVGVEQLPKDRLITLKLKRRGESLNLIIRLYSGAKANVIVCDANYKILELLFRRPNQNEMAGENLILEERAPLTSFEVREHPKDLSFNQFIEEYYQSSLIEEREDLLKKLAKVKDEDLTTLNNRLRQNEERLKKSSDYDSYRHSGDLLSSVSPPLARDQGWVEVADWLQEGAKVTISVDPSLSLGENIANYYRNYSRLKATYEKSLENGEALQKLLDQKQAYYEQLANSSDEILKEALKGDSPKGVTPEKQVGLTFKSGIFTILVGRNAQENEALLRRAVRGNDWWLHTRDYSGGYVFIKSIRGKSIPLETLLDGGNLALHYSKGRSGGSGDLYYTQVKYLKRVKGGKVGLVLPMQAKNITIRLDQERLRRLFSESEEE